MADNNEGNHGPTAKAVPSDSKSIIISKVQVNEETGSADASPDETDSKARSGFSPDDDVEYVHGHPVIRNGK